MGRPVTAGDSADLEQALRKALGSDVRFDAMTRRLYATDASIYSIDPIGVVYPRSADDVVAIVDIARRFHVPVLPRGGGTSLAGQTVGHAVVLDFSKHMHRLMALDPEARTARVQPGLVQDELNQAAAKHGLMFAPDTSTANRATLGGMMGNNSCGSRSARYGMTIDHVDSLDVVLSDASRATLGAMTPDAMAQRGRGETLEAKIYRDVSNLVDRRADTIRTGFPPYWRRSGGYRLERLLPENGGVNLAKAVIGSEGTLAITTEATVRLVPVPKAVAALARITWAKAGLLLSRRTVSRKVKAEGVPPSVEGASVAPRAGSRATRAKMMATMTPGAPATNKAVRQSVAWATTPPIDRPAMTPMGTPSENMPMACGLSRCP